MNTVFIFPNSLFQNNKLIKKGSNVYLIEHYVYFKLFNYHKLKLILHRATMKRYSDYIKKKYKCKINYINFDKNLNAVIKKIEDNEIHFYDPVDHLVMKDIKKLASKNKKKIIIHDTPLFLNSLRDLEKFKDKNYSHNRFYIYQRKRLNILVKEDKPIGGKWSFDVQNREPFPKNFDTTKNNFIPTKREDKYVSEAKRYIKKNFKNNPGSLDFYLPTDFNGAKAHLRKFMKERFKCFGPYQDAVSKKVPIGCHSLISPFLNIGLLTPKYVITSLEKFGKKDKVPLTSLEGILRQIIGWREYTRMLYIFERKSFEKKNHLGHRRKLKKYWFDQDLAPTTGFNNIDHMITKAMRYGYLHHIERLMYIGNFMLINKIHPKNCFKWFMELFIDSYNWVMYSNVYGMSQYSAGPIMMTRPYFSSSSYIDRMSDYKKLKNKYLKIKLGDEKLEWFEVWDALYYNFIALNRAEFKKNYAIARQVKHWDNKSKSEKSRLKRIAIEYMKKY
jgi:deoxyribodipyrimidine photolyase-related protein